MREWVGQRVIHNLESAGAQLKNKHYEHTIGVDRNDIEDDKLGIYAPMFSMQGEIVARHPDELVWGLLPTGFATTGFDGQCASSTATTWATPMPARKRRGAIRAEVPVRRGSCSICRATS